MSQLYTAALTGLRWGPWPEDKKDKGETAWRRVVGEHLPPAPATTLWAEHFCDGIIREIFPLGYDRLLEIHPDHGENSGLAISCHMLGVSARPILRRVGFDTYAQFSALPPEEPEDRKDAQKAKARKAEVKLRDAALSFATATRRVALVTRTTWTEDIEGAMDMNMLTRAIRDLVPLCGLSALESGTRLFLRCLA